MLATTRLLLLNMLYMQMEKDENETLEEYRAKLNRCKGEIARAINAETTKPEDRVVAIDVQAYLANPGQCPYCGSVDIEGDSVDVDGEHATQPVSCHKCVGRWTDVYTLTGVISELCGHSFIDHNNDGVYGTEICRFCGELRKKE